MLLKHLKIMALCAALSAGFTGCANQESASTAGKNFMAALGGHGAIPMKITSTDPLERERDNATIALVFDYYRQQCLSVTGHYFREMSALNDQQWHSLSIDYDSSHREQWQLQEDGTVSNTHANLWGKYVAMAHTNSKWVWRSGLCTTANTAVNDVQVFVDVDGIVRGGSGFVSRLGPKYSGKSQIVAWPPEMIGRLKRESDGRVNLD
jgi:hypothetical protein